MRIILCLGLSLFSLQLLAQSFVDPKTNELQMTAVGKVILVKGEATRTPHSNGKAFIPLKEGTEVFSGDDLFTMEKSLVKIEMTDDTVITLGPKSHFEIVLYNFESKSKRNATFELKDGHLRSDVKQPSKENELTYKVGRVAMGIRGTQIVAEIVKEVKGEITKIAIIEGKAFIDLTKIKHKTLKKIGLDLGKLLNTKLITANSKEEDFLIPLTTEQLKRLLSPDSEDGATFLKDLDRPVAKKNLQDSVNAAVTNPTKGIEAPVAASPENSDDGITLQKKKKVWTEILEEDQNTHQANP